MRNNYLNKIIYIMILMLCFSCNQRDLIEEYKYNEERIEIAQKYILHLLSEVDRYGEFWKVTG